MKRIHEIIEEVKNLRGANVRVFGQPTTLPAECDKYTIDIIDVLNHLEDYEMPKTIEYWDFEEEDGENVEVLHERDIEGYLQLLEEQGFLVEEGSGNTYNWSAPISNDFYYHVYKNSLRDDNFIIEIAIHKYGDVRCGYTDNFYIIVDSMEEFHDILSECDLYNTVEIDGKEYYIDVKIFSDVFEVSEADGNYIGEIYAENDEEAIKEIKKLLSE